MTRYRDFAVAGPLGYRKEYNRNSGVLVKTTTSSYTAFSGWMTDTVGPRTVDNACIASKLQYRPPCVNGSYDSFSIRYVFENFTETPGLLNLQHLHVSGDIGFSGAATRGAAMANPSLGKDQLSIPVSLIELRELPQMVLSKATAKRIGGGKYRRGDRPTNSVAESEFGWAPIISDIKGLFSFPDLVEKEIARLNKIRSYPNSRVSRTRTISIDTAYSSWSQGSTWDYKKETTVDYKVTSRWRPRDHIKNMSDPEMAEMARKLVLSLTPQSFIRQAWDILPWSWLIDWFSDFGDYLSLTDNSVAYLAGPTLITRKAKTTVRVKRKPGSYNSKVTYRDGLYHHTDWERAVNPFLTPNFHVPLLTTRQTLILSSIAFNNIRR